MRGPSDKMFLANAFVIMVFFSTTAQFSHHLAGREPEGEAERAAVFKKKTNKIKNEEAPAQSRPRGSTPHPPPPSPRRREPRQRSGASIPADSGGRGTAGAPRHGPDHHTKPVFQIMQIPPRQAVPWPSPPARFPGAGSRTPHTQCCHPPRGSQPRLPLCFRR